MLLCMYAVIVKELFHNYLLVIVIILRCDVFDFEFKFRYMNPVGMIYRKENHHSKAGCFSFCLVLSLFSYYTYRGQKCNVKL